jgi:hypothetical protein
VSLDSRIDAGAFVVPGAGDLDFAVVGGAAFDAEAAGAHGGEKGFDAVDAVPEEVGVGGFEASGAAGIGGLTWPMLPLRTAWVLVPKRREEDEKTGMRAFSAGIEDADRIGEGAGDGFVDEGGFACLEAGEELFEVGATVVGLEEDDIDFVEQFIDGRDDFDAVLLDLSGEFGDALGAGLDVFAALSNGSDDTNAHEFWGLRGGGVEHLGEGDGVRGIETDDASADVLSGARLGEQSGESAGDGGE